MAGSFGESFEEAIRFPGWPQRLVGDAGDEGGEVLGEAAGGGDVDGLLEVVGNGVIAGFEPLGLELLFGRTFLVAELEGEGGDAGADEAVLVAADETALFGNGIGEDGEIELFGDEAGGVAEGGFVDAEKGEELQGMEGHEHIHVAIGDDLLGGDGGVLREVAGALEAFLFAGDGDEEDAAIEWLAGLKLAGDFEHGGDAGGVIEGTVKDAVVGEGDGFTEVVEVGADDDELVFKFGMGAQEFGDDVGAIEFSAFDGDGGR